MIFHPNVSSRVTGISITRPVAYLGYPGGIVDLWHVRGEAGGAGSYESTNPRVVILLDDTPPKLALRLGKTDDWHRARLAFIPANQPVWSRVEQPGAFAHLDLYFEQTALATKLIAAGADPVEVLALPLLMDDDAAGLRLARTLAAEVAAGAQNELLIGSIATAILCRLLSGRMASARLRRGGLTPRQLEQVKTLMQSQMHRRISIAEMAAVAGLSESWFSRAFRASTGKTPHRALQSLRIEAAQRLLCENTINITEIAGHTGFADQAHLTRAFRNATGRTPGQWRATRFSGSLVQDETNPDCFSQDIAGKTP